jgi:hypothetical protein
MKSALDGIEGGVRVHLLSWKRGEVAAIETAKSVAMSRLGRDPDKDIDLAHHEPDRQPKLPRRDPQPKEGAFGHPHSLVVLVAAGGPVYDLPFGDECDANDIAFIPARNGLGGWPSPFPARFSEELFRTHAASAPLLLQVASSHWHIWAR